MCAKIKYFQKGSIYYLNSVKDTLHFLKKAEFQRKKLCQNFNKKIEANSESLQMGEPEGCSIHPDPMEFEDKSPRTLAFLNIYTDVNI